MTLAAPSLKDEWFFPDGENGQGIQESIIVYNPNEDAVTVQLEILTQAEPEAGFVSVEDYDLDGQSTLVVDVDDLQGLPSGRHSIRVLADPFGVVAEQVITRDTGSGLSTAVTLGTRDVGPRWWVPTPLTETAENALVVANRSGVDTAVTVLALGPGGLVPVLGLQDVPLGAPSPDGVGGTLVLDLVAAEIVGKPLLVQAGADVAVVRRPVRGADRAGRGVVIALIEE
jgi:hypothetical protein